MYRAVDQYGQVIDVLVSARRDAPAARRFFQRALATLKVTPAEVVTDAAAVYPGRARRADPVRVAPRRAVRQQSDRSRSQPAQAPAATDARAAHRPNSWVVIAAHAFMQNNRRGHYELGLEAPPTLRVAAAFTELAHTI